MMTTYMRQIIFWWYVKLHQKRYLRMSLVKYVVLQEYLSFQGEILELLPGVTGVVDKRPTHLQIFDLFPPKELIKEVIIPGINKNMLEGGGGCY